LPGRRQRDLPAPTAVTGHVRLEAVRHRRSVLDHLVHVVADRGFVVAAVRRFLTGDGAGGLDRVQQLRCRPRWCLGRAGHGLENRRRGIWQAGPVHRGRRLLRLDLLGAGRRLLRRARGPARGRRDGCGWLARRTVPLKLLLSRLTAVVGCMAVLACEPGDPGTEGARDALVAQQPPERLRVQVLETLRHDRNAFTQGLEIARGTLYEGTGLEGQSYVRAIDLTTGKERRRILLPSSMFGEGITITDT